jgi:GNAT superfamily N-acetyltransferase
MRCDPEDLDVDDEGIGGYVTVTGPDDWDGPHLRAYLDEAEGVAARMVQGPWWMARDADLVAREGCVGMYLSDLSVPTACRNAGVGAAMVRKAAGRAAKLGASWVYLHADADPGADRKLRRFYERLGFEEAGGVDRPLMRAALPLAEVAVPRPPKSARVRTPLTLYLRRAAGPDRIDVEVFAGRGQREDSVGRIFGRRIDEREEPLDRRCRHKIEALAPRAGIPPGPAAFEVIESGLDDAMTRGRVRASLRFRGLGAWLYAELARLAWQEAGGVIVPNRCAGGSTSQAAQRVWGGDELLEHLDVEGGEAAVWRRRGGREAGETTPAPDGVTLIELPAKRGRMVVRPNPRKTGPGVERYEELRDYLSTDMDPWNFSYLLPDFYAAEGEDTPEAFDPDDPAEFLTTPEGQAVEPRFKAWLLGRGDRLVRDEGAYTPAYLLFDGKGHLLPDDTWLVHFTDAPDAIASAGFAYGHPDRETLGLTTWFTEAKRRREQGWNFALRALSGDATMAAAKGSYGRHAVLFQSAALEIFHNGDNQWQAIFWGPDVRRVVPLWSEGGDWHAAYGDTGEDAVSGRYGDVARWVTEASGRQLRRLLRAPGAPRRRRQ